MFERKCRNLNAIWLITYAVFVFLLFKLISSDGVAQDVVWIAPPPIGNDGFIRSWLVVGPIPPAKKLAAGRVNPLVSTQRTAGAEEKSSLSATGTVRWIPFSADEKGFVDFSHALLMYDHPKRFIPLARVGLGYAATFIDSPTEQKALLKTGSVLDIRVWLNDELIHQTTQRRLAKPDQDVTNITLKKGRNKILIEVSGGPAFGLISQNWGWGFYCRIVNPDNGPPQGLTVKLPVRDASLSFNVRATPFYVRSDQPQQPVRAALVEEKNLKQVFHAVVTNYGPQRPGEVHAKIGARELDFLIGLTSLGERHKKVAFGLRRYDLSIPELAGETRAEFTLTIGDETKQIQATLTPSPKYKFFMAESTHEDIGFTDPEPICSEKHLRAIDTAIKFIDEDKDPDFHYSIEGTWAAEQFFNARSDERVARFIELIKEGRIEIGAMHSSGGTWGFGHETISRFLYQAKRYKDRYGIPITSALFVDTPGMAWGVPQVLAKSGVKYLLCGANESFNGDSFKKNLPPVFWWEGPDGSRVLTALTEGYGGARLCVIHGPPDAFYYKSFQTIARAKATGYLPDSFVFFGGWFDNGPLTLHVSKGARRWNERYAYPKFILCTVTQALSYIEKHWGHKLPTLAGDWAGYWDGSVRNGLSRHNWTREQILSVEKLCTLNEILDPQNRYPLREITAINDALVHRHVHGGGTLGTPSEKDEALRWVQKYEVDAYVNTKTLLSRAIQRFADRLSRGGRPFAQSRIVVFNPSSWPRTGVVKLEMSKRWRKPMAMKDPETGDLSPIATTDIMDYQWGRNIPSSVLEFVARDAPALGYKAYELVQWQGEVSGVSVGDASIENEFYRINFDRESARIVSVFCKKLNREILDTESRYGFNDLAVKSPKGLKLWGFLGGGLGDTPRYAPEETKLEVIDKSPAKVAIVIGRPASACQRCEVALYAGLDSIEVENFVDVESGDRDDAGMYVQTFPLRVENPQVKVQTATAFFTPGKDQLPGAGDRAKFVVQHGCEVYNDDMGIACATAENGAFRFGALKAKAFRLGNLPPNITLLSVFLQLPNTEKKWGFDPYYTTQTFRYAFQTHGGTFDPGRAARFGASHNQPLIACRTPIGVNTPPADSLLTIDNSDVILLTLKKCEVGKGYAMRLLEVGGQGATVKITSPLLENAKACLATNFEEPQGDIAVRESSLSLDVTPYSLVTVVFER